MELFEGRNRQIRKMCEQVDLDIVTLRRISMGSLKLGDLRPGKWRFLTRSEVDALMS
jgi:pseudouridine synthase